MTIRTVAGNIYRFFQGRELLLGAEALFVLLSVTCAFSVDIRDSRGASITGDKPFT